MKNKKIEMGGKTLIRTKGLKWALTGVVAIYLSSCVNVAAPDEPIVINLNIRIEQEILIKQAKAVEEAIEENAGIF